MSDIIKTRFEAPNSQECTRLEQAVEKLFSLYDIRGVSEVLVRPIWGSQHIHIEPYEGSGKIEFITSKKEDHNGARLIRYKKGGVFLWLEGSLYYNIEFESSRRLEGGASIS